MSYYPSGPMVYAMLWVKVKKIVKSPKTSKKRIDAYS
jgi:hypothetical protein